MIDDTRVEVGGREMVLYVAFEPLLRRVAHTRFFEASNILTAPTFVKRRVRALYRSRMKVLTERNTTGRHASS